MAVLWADILTYHPYATPYGHGGYGSPYYNSRTGAYGYSNTSHGAYGKTTTAAQYNPYTGTYARGASTSNAYGRLREGIRWSIGMIKDAKQIVELPVKESAKLSAVAVPHAPRDQS